MGRLLTKRAAGEYDGEALDLTARVLTQNPDLHTLWNFRREILQQMQQRSSLEQLQAAVEVELDLSAACLRASPKSYCAWHQRAWALLLAPRPPWARELQLTGAFLQCDERNFHCWDHRRFVVARGRADLALRANAAAVPTPDGADTAYADTADADDAGLSAGADDAGLSAGADDAGLSAGADDAGLSAGADDAGLSAGADDAGLSAGADDAGLSAGADDADTAGADDAVLSAGADDAGLSAGADDAGLSAGADDAGLSAGADDAVLSAGADDAGLSAGADDAGLSAGAELAFTHGLLSSNFSNFSSWHYRAQQLAVAGPRTARPHADALPAEFELVQNAIFTDPDDQSAWLYHRWLLGRAEQAESVSCLYVSQSLQLALVVFTRPINVLTEQQEVVLSVDGRPARGSWVTPDRRNRHSLVWLCLLQDALRGGESVRVYWGDRPPKECVLGQGGGESWIRDEASEMGVASLGAGLSPQLDSALLQEQLRTCTELLGMEPQNK
ncbi:geranylgeranyl transferase type-2 subunit alpha-like, partial [Lampetra fluviatilis]